MHCIIFDLKDKRCDKIYFGASRVVFKQVDFRQSILMELHVPQLVAVVVVVAAANQ